VAGIEFSYQLPLLISLKNSLSVRAQRVQNDLVISIVVFCFLLLITMAIIMAHEISFRM
jgi:hypothetical protein